MAVFTGTAKWLRRIALKRNDTTTLDPDDFIRVVNDQGNILTGMRADGSWYMVNYTDWAAASGLVENRVLGDNTAQFRIYNVNGGFFHFSAFPNYFEMPGIRVKEGTNRQMGTATLSAGTVTVSTTAVTANSRVFLTGQNSSGTAGNLTISARTAGTSFTITSTSNTDTRIVAWLLVEPTSVV